MMFAMSTFLLCYLYPLSKSSIRLVRQFVEAVYPALRLERILRFPKLLIQLPLDIRMIAVDPAGTATYSEQIVWDILSLR